MSDTKSFRHRGRIKLLREYVSKSSDALNTLTITQLACERGLVVYRSRTALRGLAYQLAVRGPIRYGMQYSATRQFVSIVLLGCIYYATSVHFVLMKL